MAMEKVPTREDQAELEQSEGSTKEATAPPEGVKDEAQRVHAKTFILLAVSSHPKSVLCVPLSD